MTNNLGKVIIKDVAIFGHYCILCERRGATVLIWCQRGYCIDTIVKLPREPRCEPQILITWTNLISKAFVDGSTFGLKFEKLLACLMRY